MYSKQWEVNYGIYYYSKYKLMEAIQSKIKFSHKSFRDYSLPEQQQINRSQLYTGLNLSF